jgi:hypothetical protein
LLVPPLNLRHVRGGGARGRRERPFADSVYQPPARRRGWVEEEVGRGGRREGLRDLGVGHQGEGLRKVRLSCVSRQERPISWASGLGGPVTFDQARFGSAWIQFAGSGIGRSKKRDL